MIRTMMRLGWLNLRRDYVALGLTFLLPVIFFSIFFGYFITRIGDRQRKTLTEFFEAAFQVMMKLAGFALLLVPFGVFALMVKVVGETGYEVFIPLGKYMLCVFFGLVVHAFITTSCAS